jgi:ribonuclease R
MEVGDRLMVKKMNKKDNYAEREAQKYEHPIVSREYIIEHLEKCNQPISYRQLIEDFNLTSEQDQEALRRRLLAMARDGQLLQNRRGAFGPIGKMELLAGYIIGHKDGFGFFVPDDGSGDLYLNPKQMRSVFPNDRVLVRVSHTDYRGRREGIIAHVLEHCTHELVGRLIEESGSYFLEPSNQRITQDILISPDDLNGASHAQMVVVKIIQQPSATLRPRGKVIEILGEHMAPGMEIDVAIRNHAIPYLWPEAVLKEAASYSTKVPSDALEGRLDLRKEPFVTIDGEDAKDFDDAVYCKKASGGGWVLYVAIADVSHYVKPNTALDIEALKRGNSVYFPERVIPMLPEVLSNELCSLKPNVDRLTMVCEMAISSTGKITRYQFHESVIKSHARLTYNQVYAMIEQNDLELQQKYHLLLQPLKELFSVYRTLHAARVKRGAIDFDLPETKIVFGEGRKIERIIAVQRNDAHKLIEECMLCANICAARYLLKNECDSLYRNHEGPTLEKLNDLRKFLGQLGLKLPGKEEPTPNDYAKLLLTITDRLDAHLIQTIMLRSLSQAVYSPENKGHFGLAFDAYAHFTSPIRRYPDLLVHRGIRKILRNENKPGDLHPQFIKFGEHCSMTERRADDATREAVDWLKCEYMLDKVGEEFSGVISSVTSFGLFVELRDIYVEGLIHISMLRNDYYQFDSIQHALSGERTGKRYRLGDALKVKVVKVDLDQRKIDFILADELEETRPPRKKKQKNKVKNAKLLKQAKISKPEKQSKPQENKKPKHDQKQSSPKRKSHKQSKPQKRKQSN